MHLRAARVIRGKIYKSYLSLPGKIKDLNLMLCVGKLLTHFSPTATSRGVALPISTKHKAPRQDCLHMP
jgi:hypothetical protein